MTVQRPLKPERWGVVCDHRGTFWEHPCAPNVDRDTKRTSLLVQVTVKVQPVENSTQRMKIYYRWLTFKLQPDHKIQSATQSELISTYVPLGSGYCQKTESLKEFDYLGEAASQTDYRYNLRLAKHPKMPVTDASGRDYLTMFRKYLSDNKMLSLMP